MREILEDYSKGSWISKSKKYLLSSDVFFNAWGIALFLILIPIVLYWLIFSYTYMPQGVILWMFSVTLSGCLWITCATLQVTSLSRYSMTSYFSGVNDDDKSVTMTAHVIKNSNKWVAFYDYGEEDKDNIYSSEYIKQLLIDKLSGEEPFKVNMIFAKPKSEVAKLDLVKALDKWQAKHKKSSAGNVLITYKPKDKHDTHYKINDTGHAFLTQHAPGAKNREFEYFTPRALRPISKVNKCLDFHNRTLTAT